MYDEVSSSDFFRPWNNDGADRNNNCEQIIIDYNVKCEDSTVIDEEDYEHDDSHVSSSTNKKKITLKDSRIELKTGKNILSQKSSKISDDDKIADDENSLQKKSIQSAFEYYVPRFLSEADKLSKFRNFVDDSSPKTQTLSSPNMDNSDSYSSSNSDDYSETGKSREPIIARRRLKFSSPMTSPEETPSSSRLNYSPPHIETLNPLGLTFPKPTFERSSSFMGCNNSTQLGIIDPNNFTFSTSIVPSFQPSMYLSCNYPSPLGIADTDNSNPIGTIHFNLEQHNLYRQQQLCCSTIPTFMQATQYQSICQRLQEEVNFVNQQDEAAKKLKKVRAKKFPCPLCNHAFSNRGQLIGHMRSHTGEKPFVCDHKGCDKAFTRNEELTRHKRIHTGLKPFKCIYCEKSFGRKDHLTKHMKIHIKVLQSYQMHW